jgi:hypothetical protein
MLWNHREPVVDPPGRTSGSWRRLGSEPLRHVGAIALGWRIFVAVRGRPYYLMTKVANL